MAEVGRDSLIEELINISSKKLAKGFSQALADLGEARGKWKSPWGQRYWRQPLLGAHFTVITIVLASVIL